MRRARDSLRIIQSCIHVWKLSLRAFGCFQTLRIQQSYHGRWASSLLLSVQIVSCRANLALHTGTLAATSRLTGRYDLSFLSGVAVRFPVAIFSLVTVLTLFAVIPKEASAFRYSMAGYIKSLNFFVPTSGMTPESAVSRFGSVESKERLFSTLGRFRLKLRASQELEEGGARIAAKIDYDHQAQLGSFVSSGDMRIARKQTEDQQFLDLSQSLVDDEDGVYEQRLYRASLVYDNDLFKAEVGRQQIPWGVGYFFTPTDVFNPFNPFMLELDERAGVDAVHVTSKRIAGNRIELIYTPDGKQLHPDRYIGKVSRDVKGYEVSLLGGRIERDHVLGFDFSGNLKDSALRGEFLFREAATENDFMKFTVNIDYNFPHNIYGLLEYHYNGQGKRQSASYERARSIKGEIQQLAQNYLAGMLGHDLTPLLRIENRAIFNMDDSSLFLRPEIQYEPKENWLATLGTQLFFGADKDELGGPENLFFGEVKFTF